MSAITPEYARHQIVVGPFFNIVCRCGYKGTVVSKKGDYEQHVAEAVEAALLRDLLEQFPRFGLIGYQNLLKGKLAFLEDAAAAQLAERERVIKEREEQQ